MSPRLQVAAMVAGAVALVLLWTFVGCPAAVQSLWGG